MTLSLTCWLPATVTMLATFLAIAGELHGDRHRLGDVVLRQRGAGEHDAVGRRRRGMTDFDLDVRARNVAGDGGFERVADVGARLAHLDVEHGDVVAGAVEEEDVGVAAGDALDDGAGLGAHHRGRDGRLADDHLADIGRQVDDHRLVDVERDRLGDAQRVVGDLEVGLARRACAAAAPSTSAAAQRERRAAPRQASAVRGSLW